MTDIKNLIITILLSTLILLSWQYFFVSPKTQEIVNKQIPSTTVTAAKHGHATHSLKERHHLIDYNNLNRIKITSDKLHGSFNLKGALFDDLSLAEFRQSQAKNSNEVILLSPFGSYDSYFVRFGWLAHTPKIIVPDDHTLWRADKEQIGANQDVNLSWHNGQGLEFLMNIKLDSNYMFTVTQTVKNHDHDLVQISPFGLINRMQKDEKKSSFANYHEGFIGFFKDKLVEETFEEIKKGGKGFKDELNGWLGITDKYWLTAIIPSNKSKFNTEFRFTDLGARTFYQVDYIGTGSSIAKGATYSEETKFFAGAKQVKLLDQYAKDIPLFDRSVDFGMFYFMTKPMFLALNFLNSLVGNFGVAILVLGLIIKIILFPMANKSYHSMNRIKKLHPHILKLRERYAEDKLQLNREIMELYKREKVNPLSGCLPILVQIPVFLSLFKVISVTIELRHAPFFGWIHDLSAPDPLSLFNLFGLIPISLPSFLVIGVLPILMGVTMVLQQKMNPEPTDPVQAKVMKLLPLVFVFMFHGFPAGLMLNWCWNNILSILQQWYIARTSND
ncbi:MAG: hypothetical protein RIT35_1006 [Pseudomonadota bacterium]|jgi:YidC/Oxa1 family membrane protein insertase